MGPLEDEFGNSLVDEPEEVVPDGEPGLAYGDYVDVNKTPPALEALQRRVAKLEGNLRDKDKVIAEHKLVNKKLMCAYQLAQHKDLTQEQRQNIAAQLKEAKTVREVELVFKTALAHIQGNSSTSVNEGRVRPGASSRVVSSSPNQQTLNENNVYGRWHQLANIRGK